MKMRSPMTVTSRTATVAIPDGNAPARRSTRLSTPTAMQAPPPMISLRSAAAVCADLGGDRSGEFDVMASTLATLETSLGLRGATGRQTLTAQGELFVPAA